VVNRLKDHCVDLEGFIILKGNLHLLKSISKSLDADTDWTVTHVGVLSLGDWVIVAIDDRVEVLRDTLGNFVQVLVVELFGFVVRKLREGDRSEVADGNFVLVGVLNDLGAEV